MITTDLLKEFKDSLDICNLQVTELLRQRKKQELFKNAEDYHNALIACQYYPDQFYKLRIFDSELTLMFNSRIKKFYIDLQTQKYEFVRKQEFLDFISLEKLIYKPDLKHFNIDDSYKIYIPQEYEFDKCVKIFLKFCKLYLSLYINSEALFIYNI